MEPWMSWSIFFAVAGLAYYYYSQRAIPPQTVRRRSSTSSDLQQPQSKPTKKEERARRKPAQTATSDQSGSDAPFASATEAVVTAPGKKRANKNKGIDFPATAAGGNTADDDGSADTLWAQQLDRARQGTKLSAPTTAASRARTVKVSATETSPPFSSASSSGGFDADDDVSPISDPAASRAGDVSDMLEPKAAGPSILRLTTPENGPNARAPRPQKEFQAAETKKQRQNRKKNEERKAATAGTEEARKVLLENQRRTAREARGEPARNGLQQARAPSSNAWSDRSQSSRADSKLDEKPDETALTPTIHDVVDRAAALAVGNAQVSVVEPKPTSFANGLSEHEQLEAVLKVSEDESGWNTVSTKKAKKPTATGTTIAAATTQPTQGSANGFASLKEDAE